jgi:two-component system, cell cycle response regulator CpdR
MRAEEIHRIQFHLSTLDMAKVLIVDDEAPIRTLLTIAFTQAGFDVSSAEDGSDAIELLNAERFDAVLSDVMMPRTNGHELARWVAERFPLVRTVLMSGFDLGCEECPLAQRCTMLAKPFRPSDAVSLVASVLSPERAS